MELSLNWKYFYFYCESSACHVIAHRSHHPEIEESEFGVGSSPCFGSGLII